MDIPIIPGIDGVKIRAVSIMDRVNFYLSIFLFWMSFLAEGHESISAKIMTIPENEQSYLEFFFKRAVSLETFAFVLFGDKPMALTLFTKTEAVTEYEKRTNPLLIFAYVNEEHGKFCKGFEVWKKYQSLFPSKNFIFIESHEPIHQETRYLFLINKKTFIRAIQKHPDDFKQVLGNHITPQLILERIQRTKNVFSVLKHNNLLIGILFGYGRHNAFLFQKMHDFHKKFPMKRAESPYKLKMFNNTELPLNSQMLDLPRFAADLTHSETEQLKQKYLCQRRLILNRYKRGNFLEITLQQFCQPN